MVARHSAGITSKAALDTEAVERQYSEGKLSAWERAVDLMEINPQGCFIPARHSA